MVTPPGPEPRRHWLRILFVLPFVAMLWVSSYNHLTPELFGFQPLSRGAEHRAPLIVNAMKQDRQQQTVIDVGEITERCPG